MVQTLARPANLDTIPSVDLCIIDEAHHAAAPTYKSIIARVKDRNPKSLLVGFTATPNRGDKKGLRSVFDNCADQITLKELIDLGFLVPPKAYAVDLGVNEDLKKVHKTALEYDMGEVEQVMNKQVINDEVVRHWQEKAGNRQTIIFCSTIAHAETVTAAFTTAGVKTEMVTGDTPDGARRAILTRLDRGETQVVVNVAVLTEGFDSQTVSCIVLLRPCSYKSTMIQMIGRGLRVVDPAIHPGVKKSDCVVLDFGISLMTHGDINTDVNLDGYEGNGEFAAPEKHCPECGAELPAAVRFCPLCGFEFVPEPSEKEIVTRAELTELDILNASPFQWVDVFGYGRLLVASGFDAAFVASADGVGWYAMGKINRQPVRLLRVSDRRQAIAAADDFLRENETEGSAHKSKTWLKHPPSDKQREFLTRMGYQIQPVDFGWTKYSAACHLAFQWNRKPIERLLFTA